MYHARRKLDGSVGNRVENFIIGLWILVMLIVVTNKPVSTFLPKIFVITYTKHYLIPLRKERV